MILVGEKIAFLLEVLDQIEGVQTRTLRFVLYKKVFSDHEKALFSSDLTSSHLHSASNTKQRLLKARMNAAEPAAVVDGS